MDNLRFIFYQWSKFPLFKCPYWNQNFQLLNWDKFHQKQISRQYKSVEIYRSHSQNLIQWKYVKITLFLWFFKKIISYTDCSFTCKEFSWHEKFVNFAKSAKRRCKVSSYNQQVQLFLNQGLATGNLPYLVLDLAKGVHLCTKISLLCRPIRFKPLSNTLFLLVQETLI